MRESHRKNNYRSWVEINTDALRHNFLTFRNAIPKKTKIMAVVKSNAYGYGMIECARIFASSRHSNATADWFGVDDIDEALALRKAGIEKPILVLGYTLPSRYAEASKKNIYITISSLEQLKKVTGERLQVKGLKIHLKIDTGLHRQGVSPGEIQQVLKTLSPYTYNLSPILLEGLYSHFAGAESKKFEGYSKKQIAVFEKVREQFKQAGFFASPELGEGGNPICHMDGTAASLLLPDSHFDMVRLGIGLYGLWPSEETRLQVTGERLQGKNKTLQPSTFNLKPALSWKSIISEVKKVKKGERVGYDLTEKLKRDSILAVVPVGYWHGYPRALSGKGEVEVKGYRCKVIGRISMDMMVVDLTNVRGAKEGDEVILIGKGILAEEVAEKAGTINYEIVTRINPLLPRIFK